MTDVKALLRAPRHRWGAGAVVAAILAIIVWAVWPSVNRAMRDVRSSDSGIRTAAIERLVTIGPRAVPAMVEALGDPAAGPAVVEALRRVGPAAVDALVTAAWESGDSERARQSRIRAVQALGGIVDTRAIEALIELLTTNASLRLEAREALTRTGAPAVGAIRTVLTSPRDEPEARRAALEALGGIKVGRTTDVLLGLLNDSTAASLHPVVLQILATMPPEPRIADAVMTALASPSLPTRDAAIAALVVHPDRRAMAMLLSWLDRPDSTGLVARALGALDDPTTVDRLMLVLQIENQPGREHVLLALDRLGDAKAAPALLAVLRHWYLGPAAIRALEHLNWQPAHDNERVLAALAHRDGELLLADWDTTRRVLLDDLRSDRFEPVVNAAYGLLALGRPDVVPAMIVAMDASPQTTLPALLMHCGEPHLETAAASWARRHGFQVTPWAGFERLTWGNWRPTGSEQDVPSPSDNGPAFAPSGHTAPVRR